MVADPSLYVHSCLMTGRPLFNAPILRDEHNQGKEGLPTPMRPEANSGNDVRIAFKVIIRAAYEGSINQLHACIDEVMPCPLR